MPRCWNGIQVRLRCVCRKVWEFESPPGYPKAEKPLQFILEGLYALGYLRRKSPSFILVGLYALWYFRIKAPSFILEGLFALWYLFVVPSLMLVRNQRRPCLKGRATHRWILLFQDYQFLPEHDLVTYGCDEIDARRQPRDRYLIVVSLIEFHRLKSLSQFIHNYNFSVYF